MTLRTKHITAFIFSVVSTWAAHGWLIAVRTNYFTDGAICSYYLRHSKEAMRRALWMDLGLPLDIPIIDYLGLFSDPALGYAITSIILFVLINYLVYLILQRMESVTYPEALLAMILYSVHPFMSAWPTLAFFPYSVQTFTCCLALFLFLLSGDFKHGVWLFVISLVLIFTSFEMKSLLVFAPVIFLLGALFDRGTDRQHTSIKGLWASNRMLFCKLMLVWMSSPLFWFLSELFFPVGGSGANYNRPARSIKNLIRGYWASLDAFWDNVLLTFSELGLSRTISAVIWIVVGLLTAIVIANHLKNLRDERKAFFLKIVVAIVIWGAGLFPYITVSKWPASVGVTSRSSILPAIGFCFGLAVWIVALNNSVKVKSPKLIGVVISTILIGAMLVISAQRYRGWFLRRLQDEEFLAWAKKNPQLMEGGTFLVEQRPPTDNIGDVSLRFYEYSYILNDAWGEKQKWAVFDIARDYMPRNISDLQDSAIYVDSFEPGRYLFQNLRKTDPVYGVQINFDGSQKDIPWSEVIACAIHVECVAPSRSKFHITAHLLTDQNMNAKLSSHL